MILIIQLPWKIKALKTSKLEFKDTRYFWTRKQKKLTTIDGYSIYELVPNEKVRVESAIAEIDDDIPFQKIEIIQKGDSISVYTMEEIKNLLGEKILEGPKKPYNNHRRNS